MSENKSEFIAMTQEEMAEFSKKLTGFLTENGVTLYVDQVIRAAKVVKAPTPQTDGPVPTDAD